MPFNQLQRADQLPRQIAMQIGREISEGRLVPGDRLPTEHALAKSFGVSRTVVREAIAQLRNEGIVESRQGIGAFVVEADRRRSIRIEDEALTSHDAFRSLFQLRAPLEVEAAGLAARHHTAAELAALDEALARMSGIDKWTRDGINADLAFHQALATATHNEYFTMILGFVAGRISATIDLARERTELDEIVEVTIAEHRTIRDAVAARNVAGARTAMRDHIRNAASRLGLAFEGEEIDVH
jgi:DNA-binding FadR family transcriptional regulator